MTSCHHTKMPRRTLLVTSLLGAALWLGLPYSVLAQQGDQPSDHEAYPNVAITDLMVNVPDADLDAFARQYLQQAAPPPAKSQPAAVQHRAAAPSAGKHIKKSTPSTLNINEVILNREQWLSEINNQADAALANNDWPLAEVTLAQALGEYGDAHDTRLRLAALFYGRGALDQTRAVLQQGIQLAPAQPDLRLTLARLLAEQGRFAAASHLLNETHPPLATHLDYYSLKADMARRSNQCGQAISTYKQLLEHNRVGGWWLGLGLCQRELGEDFTAAFLQARASADLGVASQRFVEQQLQQREQDGKAQTH